MKDEYAFTPEDFAKILDNKNIRIKCAICGEHPHNLVPDLNSNIFFTSPCGTGKTPKTLLNGYFYTIGLVCRNCGHIAYFAANFIRDYLARANSTTTDSTILPFQSKTKK